jgi:hypothetical protein
VETLGLSVVGRLTYDGQPLESITDAPARFWLRHEGRGEVQPGTVRYQGGQFWLGALPPGKIGAQVNVDLERSNPPLYPGDLYRWKTFETGPSHAALEVDLWKVIRLREPQDNNAPLSGWSTKCEDMFTTDSRQVAWDRLADGVVYEYTIEKVECPYAAHEQLLGGTTTDTSLALTLPPTGEGHFYLLRLYAKRGDRRMAQVLTHGLGGGLGWDYRFRLR